MPREGFIREDGMVYWRHRKNRGDIWLTPEKFAAYQVKRKEYRDMCREAYYKRQAELPENERNYFGRYDWKKNKYFIDISSSGKEVWVYKARYEKLKAKREEYRKKYCSKMKSVPKTGLKMGDQNPDNPNEYVLWFTGNRPKFGTLEQLEIAKQGLKAIYKKAHKKYRQIRNEKLRFMNNKLRRGHVHAETGMIFWEYNYRGEPRWLEPEKFAVKHQTDKERRRKNRKKQNS